jgi:hypothetical protein
VRSCIQLACLCVNFKYLCVHTLQTCAYLSELWGHVMHKFAQVPNMCVHAFSRYAPICACSELVRSDRIRNTHVLGSGKMTFGYMLFGIKSIKKNFNKILILQGATPPIVFHSYYPLIWFQSRSCVYKLRTSLRAFMRSLRSCVILSTCSEFVRLCSVKLRMTLLT